MLKAILFTGQGFCCKFFPLGTSTPGTIVLKAFVSTNTAILRGIRNSNPGSKRSESGTKYSEDRKGGFSTKPRTLSAERKHSGARSDLKSKYSGDKKRRLAEPRTFSDGSKYPEARRDSGSKHSGDKKGRFSAEPPTLSTGRRYPEARSGFGSKYSGDKKGRFSAEPRTFNPERRYPEARSDFGSKYSGDKKGRFSAEPRTLSTERRYPEARSDFGSKYSADKKGRFSAEPRTLSPERRYPEARSDFGSKYSGDKKGRFSAEPRTSSAERRYPDARSDFTSQYSSDKSEKFSAQPRTFNTERNFPQLNRDDPASKYDGDRKGRFSAGSQKFTAEQRYPGANRSETGFKINGDRNERFSAEQQYPRINRDDAKSKYEGERKGRFSAESRTSTAEQRYPEADRSEFGVKNNGDRKERFSAEQKYPQVNRDNPKSKYEGERKLRFSAESQILTAKQSYPKTDRSGFGAKNNGDREERFSAEPKYSRASNDGPLAKYSEERKSRFSTELRTFTAEQKHLRQEPTQPNHNEEQDADMRGSAALEEGRRSLREFGYLRAGARDSESSWKPRSSSGEFENFRQRSGTFQGNPPTSAPIKTTAYSQQESAAAYEPTRESARSSTYTDSIDQSDDGQKTTEFDVDPRSRPIPVNVPGMDVKMNPPRGIPYTTSASEFLYGTSVVTAAIKFSRRKLYKVYIYAGENRSGSSQDGVVRKLALALGVEVVNVTGYRWLQLMDKMSNGRPHNGFVLEASPLPKLPVTGLQRVHSRQQALKVSLDHQSREDEAINGTNQDIQNQHEFPRYPFVLLLDGVVDPGNLGAIVRSAFLFGVDAIAVSKRATAPLSPVALKASAGAAESLPFLSVDNPDDFISESRQNGWKTYAAVIPQSSESWKRGSFTNHSLGHPILDHPCVLMIGGEGEGLARSLQRKADFTVSVEGARAGQGGVDSLNVSVATAMLCDAFLRKEEERPPVWRPEPLQTHSVKPAGGDDSTRSDHTDHVDLNEANPELDSKIIPDPFTGEEVQQRTRSVDLGEEGEEAAVHGSEAIDETKAHHHLNEKSVSAPKGRLF